jgi:hypothetical protein
MQYGSWKVPKKGAPYTPANEYPFCLPGDTDYYCVSKEGAPTL